MIDEISRRAGPYAGGTSTFTFGFKIFQVTDVEVVTAVSGSSAETVLTYGLDYSVTLNDDQDATPGGTVVLTSPLASNKVLSIVSAVPYTQPTQLTNYSRFPPEIINTSLDRLEVQIQQLKEVNSRQITVPATSNQTPEELLEEVLSATASAESAALSAEAAEAAAAQVNADIGSIKANMDAIQIVADDLDGREYPNVLDYGDIDDPVDSLTDGSGNHIVKVSNALDDVHVVSENIDDITGLTDTVAQAGTLNAAVQEAASAAAGSASTAIISRNAADDAAALALARANAAAQSASDAAAAKSTALNYLRQVRNAADDAAASATQACICKTNAAKEAAKAEAAAEKALSAIQSDWQMPDDEDPSYIKNRTHYIEYEKQAVYEELLDEETFTRYPDDRSAALSDYIPIDPEKTYRVIFDGVTYEDVGENFLLPNTGCGCSDAAAGDTTFETYPFRLFPLPCGDHTQVFTETSGQHTIEIYEKNYEWTDVGTHKLDPRYLPPATTTTLGAVKIGDGLAVAADGTISTSFEISNYALRTWVLEQVAAAIGGEIDLSDYAKVTDLTTAIATEVTNRDAAIAAAMASVVHTEITAAEVETAWEAA